MAEQKTRKYQQFCDNLTIFDIVALLQADGFNINKIEGGREIHRGFVL